MYALQGADQTARMHMLVGAFVVRACMLHKALIRLRECACLSRLFCMCMYATCTQGADQSARMRMFVWDFLVRICMLHKALIRLRGCTCLSVFLLYVHICYIRR